MDISPNTLMRFFSRTSTYEEELKIHEWIERSDENYKELLQQRKVFDALLFHESTSQKKRNLLILIRKMAIAVTGIAAVVALTAWFTVQYMEYNIQSAPLNRVIVPQGQRVNLTLSDGTNVWLNAKTKMEYPQSFRGLDKRVVSIDGEAYFEVSKNRKQPFIVKTSKGKIEVVGTKFYVNAYEQTKKFEVALVEGSVSVSTPQGTMQLIPNAKVELHDGKLYRKNIEDTDVFRWRDGLYCFKDLSLDKVLEQFEIYYDVRFIKENRKIPNPKMNGKFRLVDGVDYALRVLQREAAFTYHRDDESNIIYLK